MNKLFYSVVLILFPAAVLAQDAAAKLSDALKKIATFQGHFEQKITDPNGEQVGKTQGNVVIKRPGKFYWKSQKPDPVIVVGDGKILWTYDIELEQVTKQNLKRALGNSPAALLAGSTSHLEQDFTVSLATQKQCAHSDACYALAPKQKEAAFSKILIGFSKGKLIEIRMIDPLGQDVYTLFSKVQINAGVEENLFHFVPPKGVDVIVN